MNFNAYLKEIGKIKLLSAAEEEKLWREFKEQGDTAARARLIESYQPLVFREAGAFSEHENISDIIQEGTVGLIEAAENYDHRRGVAFSLYAMHRIRGRMLNFFAREQKAAAIGLKAATEMVGDSPDFRSTVSEKAERDEIIGRVTSALARLPNRERTVLESVYLQSREVNEIAAGMKLSASYIYRLQKSGLRRIRGMLARFKQHW